MAAKKALRFVNLKGVHVYDQLRYEELLFRHTKDNWFVWGGGPVQPTVILGYSGKINELVNTPLAKKDNIPLLRRFTGGGTVIVDQSTMLSSLIVNAKEVGTMPYPKNIMSWSEGIFAPVFTRLIGMRTKEKFALRENDYVIGELKIGGNAQSITRERFVHHTSFLWNYDANNMKYLTMPARRPDYRKDREHTSFLGQLSDFMPSQAEFQEELLEELKSHFEVDTSIRSVNEFLTLVEEIRAGSGAGKELDQLCRTAYEPHP